jgi:single-strand DNA-binding protein
MAGINKVIVIGNLGADPELRYTPGGQAVCDLRVATTEQWTDKGGERKEQTEWHRIVVWGKQAENCSQYLSKGRQVYVEGRLRTRQWEKDGQKHYTTEIVAQTVQFLGGGRGEGAGRERPASDRPAARQGSGMDAGGPPPEEFAAASASGMGEDDIPF